MRTPSNALLGTSALIAVLAILNSPMAMAAETCSSALSGNAFYQTDAEGLSVEATTERFLGYLGSLFESGDLRVDALVDLKNQLESGSSELSIFPESAGIVDEVHREELQKYLDQKQFDDSKVIAWLEQAIAQTNQVAEEKDSVSEETQRLFEPIRFVELKGSSFWVGPHKESVAVANQMEASGATFEEILEYLEATSSESARAEVSKAKRSKKILLARKVQLEQNIEVMQAPVTNGQWFEVMGHVPKNLQTEGGSTEGLTSFGGQDFAPDSAVVSVTWWGALIFANRLSELLGLRPVYDIDMKKVYRGGNGSNGELQSQWAYGDKLSNFGVHAPEGDIYKAEGYRLPTYLESEALLRAGLNGMSMEERLEVAMGEHEKYLDSNSSARPLVYSGTPSLINGKEVYALYNNVQQWIFDNVLWSSSSINKSFEYYQRTPRREILINAISGSIEELKKTIEGEKLILSAKAGQRGLFGQSVYDESYGVRKYANENIELASIHREHLGFRLVRSLPNKNEVSE